MMLFIRIAVFALIIVMITVRTQKVVLCQSPYLDASNSLALEAVMDFGANREKVQRFCCRGSIEREHIPFHTKGDEALQEIRFRMFEDFEKRLVRRDWNSINLLGDAQLTDRWMSQFTDLATPSKSRLFVNTAEVPREYSTNGVSQSQDWRPQNPGCFSIANESSLLNNHAETLIWLEMFHESKLLRTQYNGQIVRSEWN